MRHSMQQNFAMYLFHASKPYTRKLTMAALGFSLAMTVACGSDNKESQAALLDDTPAMTDGEAVALSKVALATLPILPIDILEAAQNYQGLYLAANPEAVYLKSGSPVQKTAAPAPIPFQVEDCTNGGIASIRNSFSYNKGDVIYSYFLAEINFTDCMTSTSTHNTNTTSLTQNGGARMHLTLVADAQTEAPHAIDMVAQFDNYSHNEMTNNTSSLNLVNGEFGISYFTNSANEITTMFAATGNINSTAETASVVTYDRFGIVLEQSNQQDLIYIYGTVIADVENEQYRYTISTIEPMGTVNDDVQGRLLIESEGSKLFIDRTNTEEVTLSADYDDDGSIDYSTIIALPLDDLINASNFTMLPL